MLINMLCTNYPTAPNQPGIGVSTSTGTDFATGKKINGVQLRVYRMYEGKGRTLFKHADHHGKEFSSREECDKFCLERGYLTPFRRGLSKAERRKRYETMMSLKKRLEKELQ